MTRSIHTMTMKIVCFHSEEVPVRGILQTRCELEFERGKSAAVTELGGTYVKTFQVGAFAN